MLLKRIFDVTLSFLLLILLTPVFAVVALFIKLSGRGHVFFKQIRVGQFNSLFEIYKFRTMIVNAEELGLKVSTTKDTRITPIGKILRKWKIDELPQLINVMKGDMSLVGPRPEVPEYMLYYTDEEKAKILSVRPGITDLASIEFRHENEILAKSKDVHQSYIENILPIKKKYYLDYVDNMNVYYDIVILFKTVKAIF